MRASATGTTARPLPASAVPMILAGPESPTLISSAPAGDQDLAILAPELIRSGEKPSRLRLLGNVVRGWPENELPTSREAPGHSRSGASRDAYGSLLRSRTRTDSRVGLLPIFWST